MMMDDPEFGFSFRKILRVEKRFDFDGFRTRVFYFSPPPLLRLLCIQVGKTDIKKKGKIK